MILSCQNITKSFGTDEILKNVSFHIEDNEKAAVVGINGAGKTTLLKIIMREETADAGEVVLAKERTVGYLAQHQDVSGDGTIYGEVLSAKREMVEMEERLRGMEEEMERAEGDDLERLLDAYHKVNAKFEQLGGCAYKSEVAGVLKGLGFSEEEFSKKMCELSGGQKTRVSLGKLLVTKPDLLLLDEPTNHLDIESIRWLENFLLNYRGAVLIVSHDRYFLDRVVGKVIEIFQHEAHVYIGNYSEYAKKKAAVREALVKRYLNQQREIKRQEEVIAKLKSFNREKSIKRAESREKMLDKMERIEKPVEDNADMRLALEPNIVSGNDVLRAEGLSKAFPPQTLFSGIDFEIRRGERVALIGNNGTGKTTILKIINGLLLPDGGTVVLGSNVCIGYYDQEHAQLHTEKTIFDEISDDYPDLNNTKVRSVLAAFLFTGDDVYKRIADLSGGERGRVALAKLMLSDANFLVLDEPTNHLDVTSKEILEEALNRYTGTVLFVSHDRYFINRTATRILELTAATLIPYLGNYDYYLEKRGELTEVYTKGRVERDNVKYGGAAAQNRADNLQNAAQGAGFGKAGWQAKKEEQARIRKLENAISRAEETIAGLEDEIAEIDAACQRPENAANSAKLNELAKRRAECQSRLDEQYAEWERLSEEREEV